MCLCKKIFIDNIMFIFWNFEWQTVQECSYFCDKHFFIHKFYMHKLPCSAKNKRQIWLFTNVLLYFGSWLYIYFFPDFHKNNMYGNTNLIVHKMLCVILFSWLFFFSDFHKNNVYGKKTNPIVHKIFCLIIYGSWYFSSQIFIEKKIIL